MSGRICGAWPIEKIPKKVVRALCLCPCASPSSRDCLPLPTFSIHDGGLKLHLLRVISMHALYDKSFTFPAAALESWPTYPRMLQDLLNDHQKHANLPITVLFSIHHNAYPCSSLHLWSHSERKEQLATSQSLAWRDHSSIGDGKSDGQSSVIMAFLDVVRIYRDN